MRISDWSSDVCSSDLFSCGERVDDRLELRATQNFVIEHPLRKLRPITGRWQGDSGHGGGFDQRAGMLGGVVKLDALTAPWHVERRSIIGSGDRVANTIFDSRDLETGQRRCRSGPCLGGCGPKCADKADQKGVGEGKRGEGR